VITCRSTVSAQLRVSALSPRKLAIRSTIPGSAALRNIDPTAQTLALQGMAPLPGGPELLLSAPQIMFTIYIHHIPFVCPAAVQLLR
jgi:hypothetical protein